MQRACHRHLSGFQVQEPLREYRRFLADHLHWVFTESVINDCVRNTVQWFLTHLEESLMKETNRPSRLITDRKNLNWNLDISHPPIP